MQARFVVFFFALVLAAPAGATGAYPGALRIDWEGEATAYRASSGTTPIAVRVSGTLTLWEVNGVDPWPSEANRVWWGIPGDGTWASISIDDPSYSNFEEHTRWASCSSCSLSGVNGDPDSLRLGIFADWQGSEFTLEDASGRLIGDDLNLFSASGLTGTWEVSDCTSLDPVVDNCIAGGQRVLSGVITSATMSGTLVTAVPEPNSLLLMGFGLLTFSGARGRKRAFHSRSLRSQP